ncbi:hypothetical protein NW754_011193 [Fusarium falciforme]|nr:hypothetical protein NW754_011193 [Fusarium falciforme]
MDTWDQNVSNVLARYEASIQAKHAFRIEEDREADEALASTLQGMHDNLATDLEKLDNEQIELKDRVMTLHDEILANLDAIDDKLKRDDGPTEGPAESRADGRDDGPAEGLAESRADGRDDGPAEGLAESLAS